MTQEDGANNATLYEFKQVISVKTVIDRQGKEECEPLFGESLLLSYPEYRMATIRYRNETMKVNQTQDEIIIS